MSGFSPQWLALREGADHRSRDGALAETLRARYLQRANLTIIDLGCGTGSNLRATAQLLPASQHWTLVDYDPALLAAARDSLAAWADSHTAQADGTLALSKGDRTITVRFLRADLSKDLDAVLDLAPKADLVTAAALFDLVSDGFIRTFAAALGKRRMAFYTVLTYNGIQRWTPRSPWDQAMAGAFQAHQMTDKGFGAASGPLAPVTLAEHLLAQGYTVETGDSPWLLGPADQALIDELATGFAAAVRETGRVPATDIDQWTKRTRTGAEVGHTDTLAFPGLGDAGFDRD